MLGLGLFLWSAPAFGQVLDPIRYTLSFPAPHTHYVEVEASYPTEGRAQIELMMAVWTPGSYLVREYERNVETLTAANEAQVSLSVEKTRKNRWRVTTAGARTVKVKYRVYAHEMSVRTNWVDDEMAVINGAPTFITLVESPSGHPNAGHPNAGAALEAPARRAHEVRMVLPQAWKGSYSGMAPGPAAHTYVAADYDTLVDSPIVAGSPSVYEFSVQGKPHYLVNFRERGVWNGAEAARDLATLSSAIAAFWGELPFDRFYFFNIIGSVRNGLEHKNSTMMNTPLEWGSRGAYLLWLSLASHEYFHAWNAKRLRPVELGPFDYENEVYTKALWFVEGVTEYYADLMLARAGLATRDELLAALSSQIRSLQATPGRLEQSVEMASYDAWIKFYRSDENTSNTAISYYVKGAVVGFLLDANIRRLTGGKQSLDGMMKLLLKRFAVEQGYTRDDLRAVAAEMVGPAHAREMRTWLERALESTSELDYGPALEWFGLRIKSQTGTPRPYLGVATHIEDQKTVVSEIRRGSPAAAAGLSLDDEIVAINGVPLPAGQLSQRIAQFTPGTTVTLSVARRDVTRPIAITLGTDPAYGWALSPSPSATRTQSQRLDAWLAP